MHIEAIHHEPKSVYAYAYDEETLHIRVRTKKGDMDRVYLFYADKYWLDKYSDLVVMHRFASDGLHDYYEAEIRPPFKRTAYAFRFDQGDESIWMAEDGFRNEAPENGFGLYEFPFLNAADVFQPPEWVKHAVFYQIFPERFANGDQTNDPQEVEEWGGKPKPDNFFGGDLQGVIDQLAYLKQLGVNALYFTPVFEASTNHKYDTIDYMKVDPHFGDNELLMRLVSVCHEQGMKVMLDAVFNHAGYYFPPFQDVLKNGEQSEYKDWFHIREFPIRTKPIPSYDTFAFEPLMPKFNTEHPEVKEYLLNVARYWIEEVGIDGWRLDVANEVDHQFWREFREVVKQAKQDAYILGETWHHSYAWLQGDQFDAVMNYPVTNAVLDFFCTAETDARQFASAINRVHARYPWSVQEVSFNLLGSHDTPRLLTKCGDDKRRMKTAVAFLLTYLGTPCIYYGDEIGLNGNTDPDCRKTMIWDEAGQDRDLFRFYQRMIALRKRYRALRDGRFSIAYARQDNRVVGLERTYAGDPPIIVLINADSTSETVSFDAAHEAWQDVYGEKAYTARGGQLKVEMSAYDVAILRAVV